VTDQAFGGILLALGSIMLLIAVFFPKYLAYVPGNRWFWPWGPPASRFGSIAGAGACLLIGLAVFGAIPQATWGIVAALWGAVILAAAIYDFTRPAETVDTLPTSASNTAKRNRSRKRRKHRGLRK
jgi:hypothetical protein